MERADQRLRVPLIRSWRRAVLAALAWVLLALGSTVAATAPPLRVFGDRNQAPWEWLENGQPQGAAVELHQALARELGRPLAIELMDWATAQRRLLAGEADLLSQMVPTPEREKQFLFTRPVFAFSFALFVRADEPGRFDGRVLDGLRIGVVHGGGPQQLLARDHPRAQLVPVAHLMEGTQRLRNNEIDALAAPTWSELHLLHQAGIGGLTHLPPFQTLHASLALRKNDGALLAQVNQALDRLEVSGELDRIIGRWAPRRVYLFSGSNVRVAQVAAGLALFALAALVLATWSMQRGRSRLEREVRQRGEAQVLMRAAMEQQRALQDITAALGRVVTPDELGLLVGREIAPLVGAPCTHMAELGPEAREWRTLGMAGFDDDCRKRWWRFPAGHPGPLDHALMDGRPVFWGDATLLAGALPEWMATCSGSRIASLYVAPLFESGSEDLRPRPIGALLLGWTQAREFDNEQRRRLDGLVRLVAQALDRTRLRRAERIALERQAELHAVGIELAGAASLADICWRVCAAALRQVGALQGAVALHETDARGDGSEGGMLRLAYSAQLPPTVAERFERMPPDTPVPLARAASTGRPEYIPDRPTLEAVAPSMCESPALAAVQALAALPLRAGEDGGRRPLGAMVFHFDEPRAFEPDERAFLEALSELAARAIDRWYLLERLQASLADSEAERALLDALIEQSPIGVVVVDAAEGRVRRISRTAAQTWGRAPLDESLERHSADWRAYAPGGTLPLSFDQWPLVRALREGLSVGPERMDIERADGARRTVDVWATPIRDAASRTLAATAMFSDVTEQVRALARERESQLRLALAVESIGIGMWDYDLASGIVEWTAPLYALLGLAPGSGQETVERFMELVLPEDREQVARSMEEATAGQLDYDATFRVRRADGQLRWLAGRGRLLRDAEGGARRLIGINFDVTPLMQVQLGLEAAARQKDEFLAMLGHELRNPLAPIANSAQLLVRAGHRPEVRDKAVAMIERQVRQLATLVDDLLEVSRVRHGRVDLRLGRIDLQPLVESALESLRALAERQRHALAFSAPAEQLIVNADATRATQMVVNLVANAIKYTPDGGRIEVELAREGEMARLEVRDNGAGIAPQFLPQVFELFAQGPGTLERAQGGLGLGLAIVRRLAELHGGTVQAASPGVGQGSTFTLRLPLARD
jgi:PAS domain S-box-containing protein